MRAARGIVHSEMPVQEDGLLWGYQLWINLSAAQKMAEPDYRDIPGEAVPHVNLEGEGFVKVIAGEEVADQPGPVVRDDIKLIFLDVYLPPHSRLTQPVPKGHTVFAYVADGTAEFRCGSFNSPATLEDRMIAVFDEGDHISAITDGAHARFLTGG